MTDTYNAKDVILTAQAERAGLAALPLGKAFLRFENLHANAWAQDTEDSFTDRSRKSTKVAWEKCNEARAELIALINQVYTK
jgi:hypothetical protein